MGAEGKIRQKILEMDLLEAVIGLAPNLFYGATLAAAILVFRNRKAPERQSKVLMIDASALYRKGRNQNTLEEEHVEQILSCYKAFDDQTGLSQIVSLDEIARNDYNLNIPRYVEAKQDESIASVDDALRELKIALQEAYQAEDQLLELLKDAGLFSTEYQSSKPITNRE